MPLVFDALYAAGHKQFDLAIERLVALLRVTLTLFSLVELVTNPELQHYDRSQLVLVLVAYAVFGIIVAWLPTIGKVRTGWQLPVHVIDIGVISYLMYFLQSISSTFLVLYVFVLLNAVFRWNWRGAIWTTFFVFALEVILLLTNGTVNQSLTQCAFIIIIGGMFAFFGVGRERGNDRLNQIAAWPNISVRADIDNQWLNASLSHVAAVLEVPRVVVVWKIDHEPHEFLTLWSGGECQQNRVEGDVLENLVSAELRDATFASDAVGVNECITATRTIRPVDQVIDKAFQSRYKIASLCSAAFSGNDCKGRLFLLDRSNWDQDYLILADIVAARLSIELEYYAVCAQLEQNAAGRERIRLSRDIHDGSLQSLAAAALQLKVIANHSDEKIQNEIDSVRRLIVGEQRRIRAFIEGRQPLPSKQRIKLANTIKRKVKKLEQQWGCLIIIKSITPPDATVSSEILHQIEFLIAEAVANAVHHGNASHINITVEQTSNDVQLRITDNGLGLVDTLGTYSHTDLATLGIGPQSILDRVTELRGSLSLVSARNGVELLIGLGCNDPSEDDKRHKVRAVG